jgi:hypothetical protein
MAAQLTADALYLEDNRLFFAYQAATRKEWGARVLLEIAKNAHTDTEASKATVGIKWQLLQKTKAAVAAAEEGHAKAKADEVAAKAAYDRAHTQYRAIQLKEQEPVQAVIRGKTLEAYRAECQPLKELLLGHAKKLVHMLDHTPVWNAETNAAFDAAAAVALTDLKGAYKLFDSKVLYYLRSGIKDDDKQKLLTFINRMDY